VAAILALVLVSALFAGCAPRDDTDAHSGDGGGELTVLADTDFLADIAQNVAGDRLNVAPVVPAGADPHSFEPTPKDASRLAKCDAVIINVTGLIPSVDELIASAGAADLVLVEAAAGLSGGEEDPHFWLDPVSVLAYVDNIATGLTVIDPEGAAAYQANAEQYAAQLRELDRWIAAQVETIPVDHRLLVTNHESFGRFAARYGFEVVGTVFPSATGEGSPSAQQLADLVGAIRATGAPAIFLETGSNTSMAEQVAREAGVTVVSGLCTHSLGEDVTSYLEMMRRNVDVIVEALR